MSFVGRELSKITVPMMKAPKRQTAVSGTLIISSMVIIMGYL